ncbi:MULTISPECIES: hypothetical protein [unclassified Adlercreutzia]|uniref:hypothetical protein n=1 Tax=unclassified Adlercreutzia TaxID=2636013 RepID=UPI0013EDD8E7|nr:MULTISPECIES: hypothetical protein [unclassified Adlercreutzia]
MGKLNDFMDLLTGSFDNAEQSKRMRQVNADFPYAEHVNTICNGKITDLPRDFEGFFMVEESYYTANGNTHLSPHLFLFTEEEGGIKLTSYELPDGYDKKTFTYKDLKPVSYHDLKPSEKFTPALFVERDGVWEGGSTSMFSPVLKFTLHEQFSRECLEVSESMEVRGRKTFGYDEPILYRRVV